MTSELNQSKIIITDNYKKLCEQVVQRIFILSQKKIALQKQFTIALAGGSTPRGVYQCMASPDYREKFQWDKIHFFWGDERWVSHLDQRSNYRMVSEALLSKVEIPSTNIHAIQTDNCDLQTAVSLYENTIADFFVLKKGEFPRFDLILLGLGGDGHTASLFPDNAALLVNDRLAIAVAQKEIAEQRITLTLSVINYAEMIFFLVSGSEKAEIVHQVLEVDNGSFLPAKEIRPSQGMACWFLDKDSAARLENIKNLREQGLMDG